MIFAELSFSTIILGAITLSCNPQIVFHQYLHIKLLILFKGLILLLVSLRKFPLARLLNQMVVILLVLFLSIAWNFVGKVTLLLNSVA